MSQSCHQRLNDLPKHIRQPEAAALVEIIQPLVVYAQHAQLEMGQVLSDTPAMSVTTIQSEVLNLSAADRARLLDVIWDSLSESDTKVRETAWAAESERRIDAYDSGKLTARPAIDVFAKLKRTTRK